MSDVERPPPTGCRSARDPSAPLALALQFALLRQARALERRLDAWAARDEPETVHRVRTAARRLRAALTRFGPLLGRTRGARRAVRRLLADFGRARDLDVRIAALEARAATADGELGPGLLWLLERARAERAREPRRLSRAGRRLRDDRRWRRWRRRIVRRPFDLRGGPADARGLPPPPEGLDLRRPLREQIATLLAPTRATLAARARRLADPSDASGHHALRIAAKRLRYELELLAPWLPDGARAERSALVTVQDALGALHDLDVEALALRAHLADALGASRAELLASAAEPRSAADASDDARRLLGEFREGLPASLALLLEDVGARRRAQHAVALAAWRRYAARARFREVPDGTSASAAPDVPGPPPPTRRTTP